MLTCQSLAYFHTRSLIHRPILCHGSGSAASAATIVLAAAAKHIIQIVDLLDERCMNYTFPVGKQDVLMNAGFSILWQCVDLEDDSKLVRDNQKSLTLLLAKVAKENTSAATEFQKVAASFVIVGNPRALQPKHIPIDTPAARLMSSMPAPASNSKQSSTKKQLQAIASRFSSFSTKDTHSNEFLKRRTMAPQSAATPSYPSPFHRTNSTISLSSTQSAPAMNVSTPSPGSTVPTHRAIAPAASAVNLDYFPLEASYQPSTQNSSSTMLPPRKASAPTGNDGWEQVGHDFNGTPAALYTVAPDALNKTISNPETLDWTGDMWDLGFHNEKAHVPQSLLSFSEESLTSGDDFVFSAPGSHNGSTSTHDGLDVITGEEAFKGMVMPVSNIEDELDFSPRVRS